MAEDHETSSMENIEGLMITPGSEINTWPVVEQADLGFTEMVEPTSEEDKGRYLHLRLHHHPIGSEEMTISTFALQPGVVEEIISMVCSANTKTMDDADSLYAIISGAIQWYREGHHLEDD